jgi:hypothetical protein
VMPDVPHRFPSPPQLCYRRGTQVSQCNPLGRHAWRPEPPPLNTSTTEFPPSAAARPPPISLSFTRPTHHLKRLTPSQCRPIDLRTPPTLTTWSCHSPCAHPMHPCYQRLCIAPCSSLLSSLLHPLSSLSSTPPSPTQPHLTPQRWGATPHAPRAHTPCTHATSAYVLRYVAPPLLSPPSPLRPPPPRPAPPHRTPMPPALSTSSPAPPLLPPTPTTLPLPPSHCGPLARLRRMLAATCPPPGTPVPPLALSVTTNASANIHRSDFNATSPSTPSSPTA